MSGNNSTAKLIIKTLPPHKKNQRARRSSIRTRKLKIAQNCNIIRLCSRIKRRHRSLVKSEMMTRNAFVFSDRSSFQVGEDSSYSENLENKNKHLKCKFNDEILNQIEIGKAIN